MTTLREWTQSRMIEGGIPMETGTVSTVHDTEGETIDSGNIFFYFGRRIRGGGGSFSSNLSCL